MLASRLVALAVTTACCWWAWMGWDTERDLDPVTGQSTGPYQPWQVAGCVLCLVAVAAYAARRIRPVAVVAVMSTAFTLAWSASAARLDDSGLWAVGAVMVLVGMLAGSSLVAGLAAPRRPKRCQP